MFKYGQNAEKRKLKKSNFLFRFFGRPNFAFFDFIIFRMNQIAILPQGSEREQGSKVQLGNIQATKHVADIIRTCLGPRSMYKMLMDPQVR